MIARDCAPEFVELSPIPLARASPYFTGGRSPVHGPLSDRAVLASIPVHCDARLNLRSVLHEIMSFFNNSKSAEVGNLRLKQPHFRSTRQSTREPKAASVDVCKYHGWVDPGALESSEYLGSTRMSSTNPLEVCMHASLNGLL